MTDITIDSTTSNIDPQPPAGANLEPVEATTGLTHNQLRQMVDDSVRARHMTQEQGDARLREYGIAPPARSTGASEMPGDKTPIAKSLEEMSEHEILDAQLAPAKPHQYNRPPVVGPGQDLTPEAIHFDQQTRQWLSTAGFPVEIGSAVLQTAHDDAALLATFKDDATRALWTEQQRTVLKNVWRGDYERKLGLAQQLIREVEVKHPGILDYLDESGLGSSAMLIQLLSGHAERLYNRAGLKKR